MVREDWVWKPCPVCNRTAGFYPVALPFCTMRCAARFAQLAWECGYRLPPDKAGEIQKVIAQDYKEKKEWKDYVHS